MILSGRPKLEVIPSITTREEARNRRKRILTLEVTSFIFGFARKRHLWLLVLQLIQNLSIRDIAHLVVLIHNNPLLVADTTFAFGHECIAGLIRLAYIAVDPFPAFIAFAVSTFPRRSVIPICQRTTKRP